MGGTIWKFPLEITDSQVIQMPVGSEFMCAKMQGGTLCLWAYVNSEAVKEDITIRIVGTGHPFSKAERNDLWYLDTVQAMGGTLVWHVFRSDGSMPCWDE